MVLFFWGGDPRCFHTSNVERRPESSKSDGELLGGVEVGRHENNTRDETALKETDQSTSNIEASSASHEGLEGSYTAIVSILI